MSDILDKILEDSPFVADDNPSKLVGTCPYCGGDMVLISKMSRWDSTDRCYFRCTKCNARSPLANSREDAYLDALKVMDQGHPFTLMYKFRNDKKDFKETGLAGSRQDMLVNMALESIEHPEYKYMIRRLTDDEVNDLIASDCCCSEGCDCHED